MANSLAMLLGPASPAWGEMETPQSCPLSFLPVLLPAPRAAPQEVTGKQVMDVVFRDSGCQREDAVGTSGMFSASVAVTVRNTFSEVWMDPLLRAQSVEILWCLSALFIFFLVSKGLTGTQALEKRGVLENSLLSCCHLTTDCSCSV